MLDKKVEYFIKVVQSGSFSAAARELYVSQPALSKQITLLERELKVRLFDRSGYRPVLTAAGEYYYRTVSALGESYAQLVSQIQGQYRRSIRIGFTGPYEDREFLQIFRRVRKRYPTLEAVFVKCSCNSAPEKLLDKTVDICLGFESVFREYEEIQYDVLHEYEISLICSHDHPFARCREIEIDEVKGEEMILTSKEFGKAVYKHYMEACRLDGFRPRIKKLVDSADELISEVAVGEGVAIVARNLVRESEVKVVRLLHSHHSGKYVLAYLPTENDVLLKSLIQDIRKGFQTL